MFFHNKVNFDKFGLAFNNRVVYHIYVTVLTSLSFYFQCVLALTDVGLTQADVEFIKFFINYFMYYTPDTMKVCPQTLSLYLHSAVAFSFHYRSISSKYKISPTRSI